MEPRAGLGERYRAAFGLDELGAEPLLQICDMARHHGRRHRERLSRGLDAARRAQRFEGAQRDQRRQRALAISFGRHWLSSDPNEFPPIIAQNGRDMSRLLHLRQQF